MRYVIIDGSAVINTIEYDAPPSDPPPGFEKGIIAIQHDTADTRWSYDGELRPPKEHPRAPFVPPMLPWWKGRAILALDGRIDRIEAFIAKLSEPDRTVTQAAWDGADFTRDSPTVIAALDAAGYTDDAAKDDLFIRGAALTR